MRAILLNENPAEIKELEKILQANFSWLEIAAICSSAGYAKKKLEQLRPEVVFIEMGINDYWKPLLASRSGEWDFEIIFISSDRNFILDALHSDAVDYLIRPLSQNKLEEAINKLQIRIEQKKTWGPVSGPLAPIPKFPFPKKGKLCIPTLKGFNVIDLDEIVCLEAQRSYTVFRLLNNKSLTVSKPLFEYDQILPVESFLRVHKSYLINLKHVKEYLRGEGGSVKMNDGMEVDISRRKKDIFLSRVTEVFAC